MNRTFLHVDMDAFFAAVEQLDHPEWRGKPVVVGAPPDRRGVVAAASYEARKFGIHSAMPSREAGRLCPHAVFAPVRMERYQEVSDQVFLILERFTPLMEPLSIDEAFLDVTGGRRLFGSGREIAVKIKAAIQAETGLTASVGVAPNKFLAKLASDMNKPDGLTLVPESPSEILQFLAPLPVGRIWGVGKVTAGALEGIGARTIGDLQKLSIVQLSKRLGKNFAEHLYALARGEDEREVELDGEEKSISREYTFPEDCTVAAALEEVLQELVADVGQSLRKTGKYAGVVRMKLRWKNFKTITRQKSLPEPCCDDVSLRDMALALFRAERLVAPVRLIGFGVGDLQAGGATQGELFGDGRPDKKRRERLSRAVDTIRDKLGERSIGWGKRGS